MRSGITCLAFFLAACGTNERPRQQNSGVEAPVIAVQPLGEVPNAVLDSVRAAISREHGATVVLFARRNHPPHAYINVRTPRHRADTLIAWLGSIKPDSVDFVIGITQQDISITKYDSNGAIKEPTWKYRDFGIFGLGYVGGPSCVVSTYRLGDGKSAIFFNRLKKVVVHELGHDRKLPHCPNLSCVMRDAVERLSSIDEADPGFCKECTARLTPSQ